MSRWMIRLVVVFTMAWFGAVGAQAGTVRGTVKNGTTGQPGAGVELTLVQLQGGMQEVAHAKSGAQGEFTFDNPGLGAQPMLVRATYQGVNFNSAVPPGSSTVQVDIFEPSKDAKTIKVPSHVVIFQPNGATLIVGEEYQIENKSQPPRAYFRTDGNFDFALPEKGQLQQVAAAGPAGMPVVQLPIDKKKNRYSIAFAFRPGESSVRYSYELPYEGNAATIKIPTIYPGGRLLVVAPPTVQVTGDGLAPGGQEQGMNLYGRQDVPAGTLVAVSLSGSAPPPNAGGGGEQAQQGRDAQQGGGEAGANIQAVPGRLDSLKWPLIFGLVAMFALGGYLLNQKKVVVAGGPQDGPEQAAGPKKAKKSAAPVAAPAAPVAAAQPSSPAAIPPNGASTLKEVDAAIGTSLDALKESLFRLELRRQAGTISEEDYARERARAEKVLRDLVRG
ncbi:MAG TPA: carboxypeptidase-like regulatory domain-containing protein [Candidatus Angelobacter sp.]|nr:carboxypeptidase-like regulatory domain-containing protein [Candidatus Angelobacter sp.]